MDWAWRLGMFILTGVPAIVGGGLCWTIFGNWTAVVVWEIVLVFIMTFVISKGEKTGGTHAAH